MIHQYKNNGYDIVMDVNSGAIHVVDDVVYDAIAMLEEKLGELEKPQQIPQEMSEEVRTELAKKYSTQDIDDAMSDIRKSCLPEMYTVILLWISRRERRL